MVYSGQRPVRDVGRLRLYLWHPARQPQRVSASECTVRQHRGGLWFGLEFWTAVARTTT